RAGRGPGDVNDRSAAPHVSMVAHAAMNAVGHAIYSGHFFRQRDRQDGPARAKGVTGSAERALPMTEPQAAQILEVSRDALRRLRLEGRGPHHYRVGRLVRYR